MEPYQEAPSQILRAIRACVTQEGEWTRDLPWMSQPALTASDRGIGNRLTGRKVAKTLRLWVGHKTNGGHQPRFCARCDKDVSRTRSFSGGGRGLRELLSRRCRGLGELLSGRCRGHTVSAPLRGVSNPRLNFLFKLCGGGGEAPFLRGVGAKVQASFLMSGFLNARTSL